MTSSREYMRDYMRKYRKRRAQLQGREINSKWGRPHSTEHLKRPLPVVADRRGWLTKDQLMARR